MVHEESTEGTHGITLGTLGWNHLVSTPLPVSYLGNVVHSMAVNTCLIPLYHTHTLEHGVVTVSTFGGHMQMVNLTRIVQMLLRLSTCVTESTRRLLDPVSSTVSVLLVQMLKSRVDWCRVSVWIAEMHNFIAVVSGTYGVWRQIHASWRGSWAYMQQKSDQRRREMMLKRDRNVVLSVLVDLLKFDHGIDFSLVVCF